MSENYFQHADHFTRILATQEVLKKEKIIDKSFQKNELDSEENKISIVSEEKNDKQEEIQ